MKFSFWNATTVCTVKLLYENQLRGIELVIHHSLGVKLVTPYLQYMNTLEYVTKKCKV
jgi:hypothetical protein